MDVRKLCDEIKPTLDKYKDEEYIELEFRLGKFNSTFFDTNIGKENFYKFLMVGRKLFKVKMKCIIVKMIIKG